MVDMTIEEKIAEAKSVVTDLESKLRDAKTHLMSVEREMAYRDYGVAIGTYVVGRGILGAVTQISHIRPNTRPWVTVQLIKKNGDLGNVTRNLYDRWEVLIRG